MSFKPTVAVGLLLLIGGIGASRASAQQSFPLPPIKSWTFRDGDRVAWIGGTVVEREQRYGWFETVWTLFNSDKAITFRNLGWSGDVVGGVSRAGFDPPEAGFKQLVDQVNAVKPTVVVVGYGANESFEGEAGLDAFSKGMERLLDALKPSGARFILVEPLQQEDLGPPLPNPDRRNEELSLYASVVESAAKRRGAAYASLDPFHKLARRNSPPLTDNGIHLSELGYRTLAVGLGVPSQLKSEYAGPDVARLSLVDLRPTTGEAFSLPAEFSDVEKTPRGLRFRLKAGRLPMPASPAPPSAATEPRGGPGRALAVEGLPDGRYRLEIDGRAVCSATSREWSAGAAIPDDPDVEQVERLRQAIIRKNKLFFHRWRPQNITYLLGFRKHEQGNNAVEIPQFDPLVAEQEKRIDELKRPVPHQYELIREEAKEAAR